MYTGQCLCGEVRFRYDGPLGPLILCHCSQCRRAHGSAFSASTPVQALRFQYTAGADRVQEYESRPGKYRGFCGRCGSQLYSRFDAIAGILRLRVGVLNEPLGKVPFAHEYVGSKADWFEITDDVPQFDKTGRACDPN
ncbi:GFA family protein [Marinobacter sp. X15-166B]|uniref:GFA family protein n=1 Tax=Marinobacter sp. X15-166B TaxID=1897620 RepID=UPI00085C896A|nr:GFA family protein [Marinobacter sp. X15-166B]OEY68024.1 aldehyde-activating protein [Marinobacter sp. X15-166B]